jgi:hypothetical protein
LIFPLLVKNICAFELPISAKNARPKNKILFIVYLFIVAKIRQKYGHSLLSK